MSAEYHFTNSQAPVPDPASLASGFSISAPPGTDIWAKPPSTLPFNAPILHQIIPLEKFKRARVQVRANWEILYDQGGLLLALHEKGTTKHEERKWVKTGIEFVNGRPNVSTVAKDQWADWSLLPNPNAGGHEPTATIEMVREEDGSLWIYLVEGGKEKTPIREVTWVFEKEEGLECWIGAYAARPKDELHKALEVKFEELVVETL